MRDGVEYAPDAEVRSMVDRIIAENASLLRRLEREEAPIVLRGQESVSSEYSLLASAEMVSAGIYSTASAGMEKIALTEHQ